MSDAETPPARGLGAALARLLGGRRVAPAVVVTSRPFATAGGALARFDLAVTARAEREREVVRALARTVVLAAESRRREDDRYHFVARSLGDAEPMLVPLGPSLQALGERAALELARTASGRRTALWLGLPATRALAEAVDAAAFDPEEEAAVDALVAGGGLRWAVAATLARDRRRIAARMLLWLEPASGRAAVEAASERLRTMLAGDS